MALEYSVFHAPCALANAVSAMSCFRANSFVAAVSLSVSILVIFFASALEGFARSAIMALIASDALANQERYLDISDMDAPESPSDSPNFVTAFTTSALSPSFLVTSHCAIPSMSFLYCLSIALRASAVWDINVSSATLA
jgi:hypothetical protein